MGLPADWDGVGFLVGFLPGATALAIGRFLDMIDGALSVFWEAASMLSRRLGVEQRVSVVAYVVALKRLAGSCA